MSRMGEYAAHHEELIREEFDIPGEVEIDLAEYEGRPSPNIFGWFRSSLEAQSGLAIARNDAPDFDAFVSFASERRHEVAHPLVGELKKRELSVWFDEDQVVRYADRDINRGLVSARVGVVLISKEFLYKPYTRHELAGMTVAGMQGLILVAYKLDTEGDNIVRDLGRDLSPSRDVTVIRLRSNRVVRLSQRIEIAVRRLQRAPRVAPSEAEERAIQRAVDAYLQKVPDPQRIELRKQHKDLMSSLEDVKPEAEELVKYGKLHPADLEELNIRLLAYTHLNATRLSNADYEKALRQISNGEYTEDP